MKSLSELNFKKNMSDETHIDGKPTWDWAERLGGHFYKIMYAIYGHKFNSQGDIGDEVYFTWCRFLAKNNVTIEELDLLGDALNDKEIHWPPIQPELMTHIRTIRAGGVNLEVLYANTMRGLYGRHHGKNIPLDDTAVKAINESGGWTTHVDAETEGRRDKIFAAWCDALIALKQNKTVVKKLESEKPERSTPTEIDRKIFTDMIQNGVTPEAEKFAARFGWNAKKIYEQKFGQLAASAPAKSSDDARREALAKMRGRSQPNP